MMPAGAARPLGWRVWVGLFGGQLLLLILAAARNADQLNTDGVAYLRLAHYYAHGPLSLAVSGYWGPMLSWFIAPLLAAGVAPLGAARVVMAGTAMVYLAGCVALLRVLGLSRRMILAGGVLAGLASVGWSVEYISPDLLVSGLVLLALAVMLAPGEGRPVWRAVGAGGLWGLAVLAKAVALPLAVGLGGVIALVRWRRSRGGAAGRRFLLAGAVCAVVVGPWITVLSLKYGRLTFSTSAIAAHAVVGPPDRDRYHPFARQLYHPEPGRITAWEDPTSLPYATWSPFESWDYFRHQLAVCIRNTGTVTRLLGSFDLLHLGVLSAVVLAVLAVVRLRRPPHGGASSTSPKLPGGKNEGAKVKAKSGRRGTPPSSETHVASAACQPAKQQAASLRYKAAAAKAIPAWLWIPLLLAGFAGVYLPGYLERVDQRYFYAALPLLFAGAVQVAELLRRRLAARAALLARLAGPLVVISFAASAVIQGVPALQGFSQPVAVLARDVAGVIRATNRPGPVVGSGLLAGTRTGLFVAWFLDQPWYGDRPEATAAEFADIGARWVIVRSRRPVAADLATDPRFAERTVQMLGQFFGDQTDPARIPLRIFERREWLPSGRDGRR